MESRIRFIVLFILVIGVSHSCKKSKRIEKRWNTTILKFFPASFSEMKIAVDYQLYKSNTREKVGVFYSKNPNLTYETSHVINRELSPLDESVMFFKLDKLEASTVYYVYSFIKGKNGVVLSEREWFKTAPLPELQCSLPKLSVDFGFTTIDYEGLEIIAQDSVWFLKTSGEEGEGSINFKFIEEPRSTVYNATFFESFYGTNQVYVFGQMPVPYNFDFKRATGKINVSKLQNGGYKITFCDLIIRSEPPIGSCDFSYSISGCLQNQ